jgi:hypothetical protein
VTHKEFTHKRASGAIDLPYACIQWINKLESLEPIKIVPKELNVPT